MQRIMQSRPVRAFMHYLAQKGPIYAQGMTLSAFFSVFAALFIAFAIFMSVLGSDEALRDTIIRSIASSIPGLIDTGNGGAIDIEALTESRIIGWAGVVASLSLVWTAIGWIGTSREGFRTIFELPPPKQPFVMLKLTDLAVAIGIGVLVVVSSAGLVLSTTIAEEWLGIGGLGRVFAIAAQLLLDTSIVLLLYRVGGQVRLSVRTLLPAAVASAVAFQVLKLLASMLLGGVDKNPLLASVATVVVILIWLGFINQILLITLSWVAVGPRGQAYTRLERIDADEREAIAARKAAEAGEDVDSPAQERIEAARLARAQGAVVTKQHRSLAKRLRKRR